MENVPWGFNGAEATIGRKLNDSAEKPSVHPSRASEPYISTVADFPRGDHVYVTPISTACWMRTIRVCPEFIEGTNGGAVEIIGDFSVHAEPVEAFLGFFSRIVT